MYHSRDRGTAAAENAACVRLDQAAPCVLGNIGDKPVFRNARAAYEKIDMTDLAEHRLYLVGPAHIGTISARVQLRSQRQRLFFGFEIVYDHIPPVTGKRFRGGGADAAG